jgi:TRAP-type mannitol/chloroaromatic compound transport system permease small subunit
MRNLLKQLEIISESIGKTVSYLLLIMTLITVIVVIARYLFNFGSIAMQDAIVYLHATVVILAMGYSLQTNAHVRVDIFYQKLNEKQKAIIEIFGTLFFLLPFCVFTFLVSLPYVQRSWAMGEKSAEAGGIPAVFLLKTLLIALVIVLVFQAVIELIRNGLVLFKRNYPKEENSVKNNSIKIQGEGL